MLVVVPKILLHQLQANVAVVAKPNLNAIVLVLGLQGKDVGANMEKEFLSLGTVLFKWIVNKDHKTFDLAMYTISQVTLTNEDVKYSVKRYGYNDHDEYNLSTSDLNNRFYLSKKQALEEEIQRLQKILDTFN